MTRRALVVFLSVNLKNTYGLIASVSVKFLQELKHMDVSLSEYICKVFLKNISVKQATFNTRYRSAVLTIKSF